MKNIKLCQTFTESKCLGKGFCAEFGCSRLGALNESFEKSPIGSAFVGVDGSFLVSNKRFADMLGYTVDELKELTYMEITHKEDLEKDNEMARLVVKGKMESYDLEKRYIKKDGAITWTHLYVSGIFNENKEFKYYVVHAIDIDSSKRQKDINDFATDAGEVGVWSWNVSTNELIWNNEMYKIYGVERGHSLSYKNWADTIHHSDKEEAESWAEVAMKTGKMFNNYFKIVVDGQIKVIKGTGVRTGEHPNYILIGCNIDITDSIGMKKEIDQREDELEYFTYSVSHDLKSPLVTLSGFSSIISHELIEDQVDWDLIRDSSNEIQKATQGLASTIDSILHLSRVGRIYVERSLVNTQELVQDVIDLNSIKIAESNAKIINNNNIGIFVQKEIFHSIIQNMIVNAIEHAIIKGKQLVINIDFEDCDGAYCLTFSDNGSGMSKEQLENLFDYSNRQHAKGFGMMIIKKGINFHGGELDTKSTIGEGTEFKVKFSKRND